MKRKMVMLILAALLFAACSSAPVLADIGSFPPPLCLPDPCNSK